MELTIFACPRKGVIDLKAKLIELCENHLFGEWSYKSFSLVEEAIYRNDTQETNNGVITFMLEESDKSLLLVPAKIRGETCLPFEVFSQSMCNIVNLLLDNLWASISEITIQKRL